MVFMLPSGPHPSVPQFFFHLESWMQYLEYMGSCNSRDNLKKSEESLVSPRNM